MLLGVDKPQQSSFRQVSNIESMFPESFPQSFQHPLWTLSVFRFREIDLDIHFFTDSITNTKKITTDFMLL
jgi:hypothetical protein